MRIKSLNGVPLLAFALLTLGGGVVVGGGISSRAADAGLSYTAIDSESGKLPAPKKHYRFAYVSKTLINEFWQAVKVGADQAAAKNGVTVDTQAAKDESSLSARTTGSAWVLQLDRLKSKFPIASAAAPLAEFNPWWYTSIALSDSTGENGAWTSVETGSGSSVAYPANIVKMSSGHASSGAL